MKRLIALFLGAVAALTLTFCSFADSPENLLAAYNEGWTGGTLSYNQQHGVIFFNEKGSAYAEFETGGARGFFLYFDMGNYSGKGTGKAVLEILDSEGGVISTFDTGEDLQDGSFRRYSLGSDSGYAVFPENAAKIRLTISYESGEASPYFRNFYLGLASAGSFDETIEGFKVSGALNLVQVNVTESQHITLIIFVFLVALAMFGVRFARDKIKNNKK